MLGLSPALGAFLGGVLLADSEYRHELESNLEPFKGLLLGLFFISVGMSIAFSVRDREPAAGAGAGARRSSASRSLVLFVLATFFRMHLADRLLLAILLSQAGEFAFVILQFARTAGSLAGAEVELLTRGRRAVDGDDAVPALPLRPARGRRASMPTTTPTAARPDAIDDRTTRSSSSATAASARSSPACCAPRASR